MNRSPLVLLCLFLLNCIDAFSHQSSPDSTVVIDTVVITGNKITRAGVILREMEFRTGDTVLLRNMAGLMDKSRENVFNTHLFNFVSVELSGKDDDGRISVTVGVTERWYIWPLPFFQISDRNFNAWWESRDFSKLTYGIDFTFFNARGRNETLKILFHLGFNQKYGFTYRIPYINRHQTVGIGFGAGVELNHEIPVMNRENKPVYYKSSSSFPQQVVAGFMEVRLRPGYYTSHTFRAAYSRYYFSGNVMAVPGFSLSSQSMQEFVTLHYMFKDDHRDIQFYPLRGYYFDIQVNHSIPYDYTRNTWLKVYLRKYWNLGSRFYFAAGLTGLASLSETHPYYLFRGMGYGRDFVRGYEVYVMDAQHYGILKSNLKFAVIPLKTIQIPWIRTTKFGLLPFALYLNLFVDAGYAYAPGSLYSTTDGLGNDLQNKLLAGTGLGFDLTTYYDIVIRVEGSLNLLGKPNIALHLIAPI